MTKKSTERKRQLQDIGQVIDLKKRNLKDLEGGSSWFHRAWKKVKKGLHSI